MENPLFQRSVSFPPVNSEVDDDTESALLRDLLRLNVNRDGRVADAEAYFKSLTDQDSSAQPTAQHPQAWSTDSIDYSSTNWPQLPIDECNNCNKCSGHLRRQSPTLATLSKLRPIVSDERGWRLEVP